MSRVQAPRPAQADWIALVELGRHQAFAYRHKGTVTITVVLTSIMTCFALSTLAGSRAMSATLAKLSWQFLLVILVAHVVAYAAYVVAHHHVLNRSASVAVGWGRGARLVMVGFGAWSIGGGFEIDRHALEWHGATSTDASVSAIVLGLLELAVLAPAAWLCALLLLGSAGIGESETVPWLVGVPLGVIAVTALTARTHPSAETTRHADLRMQWATGVVSALGLMRRPWRGLLAAAAIAVYWAADIAALWAALQFVSTPISLPRLILGYATGYLLTRRTLPFAGAIIVEAMMAVSLVWVGVPLAAAVVAVLVYRLSDFTFTLGGALLTSSALERTVLSRPIDAGGERQGPATD
jgi:uncharacterized membrane protein YbhN (UPF0104 family)